MKVIFETSEISNKLLKVQFVHLYTKRTYDLIEKKIHKPERIIIFQLLNLSILCIS